MKFIKNFLKKRWRKKLEFYHEQYQKYYELYKSKKDFVILYRRPYPTWMRFNSDLTPIKESSEEYLKKYRYWHKKFKSLKKKLNNLHS